MKNCGVVETSVDVCMIKKEQLETLHSSAEYDSVGAKWSQQWFCVFQVSRPQARSSIIFLQVSYMYVTISRQFAASQNGIYFLHQSICVYAYHRSGCREYSRTIRQVGADRDGVKYVMSIDAVIV